MKRTGYILLFFFVLVLLSCEQKKDTSMSLQDVDVIARVPSLSPGKWNMMKGDIRIDTLSLYKGKNALRLMCSGQDSIKGIYAWHAYDLSEIEGEILIVKGKYNIEKAEDAEILSYRQGRFYCY